MPQDKNLNWKLPFGILWTGQAISLEKEDEEAFDPEADGAPTTLR